MTATTERQPSLNDLKKYAQKYGSEEVMETAVALGISKENLITLQLHLDKIEDDAAKARKYAKPKKRRLSAEKRVARLLGEETDGEEQTV